MRALQVQQPISADAVRVTDVPRPTPGPGEVLVQVEAAGINPSDRASIEGKFPQARWPRIVGRDFAGRVVEGARDLIGASVWGTGGDLGISRDGTFAEFVTVPRAAIALRPNKLSAEAAAVVGVPFVTAWSALEDARLKSGEWVIIAGAAGAVGEAAIQLAAARKARVIALVKDEADRSRLDRARVEAIASAERNDLEQVVQAATGGQGAQVALNGVGGASFAPLFASLGHGGRMVIYSAAGGREAPLDLFQFYRKALIFYGLDTATLDAAECARILNELAPRFEQGILKPQAVGQRFALSQAADAFRALEAADGKVVLLPGK